MSRKRANGEGTIRKRKNGTWEGRITTTNLATGIQCVNASTEKRKKKSKIKWNRS